MHHLLKLVDGLFSVCLLTMVRNYTVICSVTIKKTGKQVNVGLFILHFASILVLEISGDLSQVLFIRIVKQFCENANSFRKIQPKPAKFRYFFPFHLFIFYSLVQLPLPKVKVNGVSHLISIEYKIGHGFNQAMFRTLNFKMFPIMDLSSFQVCFITCFKCYIE